MRMIKLILELSVDILLLIIIGLNFLNFFNIKYKVMDEEMPHMNGVEASLQIKDMIK